MARGGVDAKGGGGGKGKGAEEREETCLCCQLEFTVAGDGGVAFCCPTSHYMCNECCGVWGEYYNLFEEPFHLLLLTVHVIPIVNSVMLDLDSSYPPKCPQCRALITNETVERQLTSDQLNTYRAHVARTVLKPGEELIECKDCGMFEVVNDDPVRLSSNLFSHVPFWYYVLKRVLPHSLFYFRSYGGVFIVTSAFAVFVTRMMICQPGLVISLILEGHPINSVYGFGSQSC